MLRRPVQWLSLFQVSVDRCDWGSVYVGRCCVRQCGER